LARLSPSQLVDAWAKHILLNLGGLRVVEGAQQMKYDELTITADTLAKYLSDQGFKVAVHNTAINTMRMWLAKAGVFMGRGWAVDARRKQDLVGLDDDEIAGLVGLTEEQRAFALALCRINPAGEHPASDVRNLAETITTKPLDRSSLPNSFLEPLKSIGFIDYRSGGTRGGKTSVLWTTRKFRQEVLDPFLSNTVKDLDAALTAYFKKAPSDIYAEMDSPNTGVKGRALEAFAVYVMRLLGLRFLFWRKRASATTGRSEIDVVMAGLLGGVSTRWQIQCKNTPRSSVDLEDVAKEIGLLPITRATHVAIIANCRFTKDAEVFAQQVMANSPVQVLLFDIADFERVKSKPGDLAVILREKSDAAALLQSGTGLWSL
jgi:site-specific DNA-methyltransferase (cytosine-N4-specific)